jgi:phosphotransferase system HPr-like phosphotransfer protein
MSTQRHIKHLAKFFGPGGGHVATCSFTTSGTTADVTTNEAEGCTVARTGVGTFVVTMRNTYKHLTVGMSVQAATTAQLFLITAKTGSTVTITQVTAGGSTAVDTLAATINLVIVARINT